MSCCVFVRGTESTIVWIFDNVCDLFLKEARKYSADENTTESIT